jgi:diguanylate cyclase (GGDEF)-like protein
LFNGGRSSIDCTVRNLSDNGACLQVPSPLGIPEHFELDTSTGHYECDLKWQTADRVGVSFMPSETSKVVQQPPSTSASDDKKVLLRGEFLALRAALDKIEIGVLLLDRELRAQFINRPYRGMWRLSDKQADSRPPFIALMYHARDAGAYEMPTDELDAYIAKRVALVTAGDPNPIDIRLANGEVVRYQCTVLPNNGRMVTYTKVTNIVRRADELERLHSALNHVHDGVLLLDKNLVVIFMNQMARVLWKQSDEQIDAHPSYEELLRSGCTSGPWALVDDDPDTFIAQRVARIRAGDATPLDARTADGKIIRARCTALAGDGRMITYTDVTDLVQDAEELERLATIDGMTGLYNRRHFLNLAEGEWSCFQRYHRPLTMLMVDIDHFKSVNDRFGHNAGDDALTFVAKACQECTRATDIIGRMGGEEFAMLLPETDMDQAGVVAERLRKNVSERPVTIDNASLGITVSVGVATATLSMSGIKTLIKLADEGLYQAKFDGRNRVARVEPKPIAEPKLAAE